MSLSPRLLDDGESVVLSTRTHAKHVLVPALVLVAVSGLAGFALTLPSGEHAGALRAAVALLALGVVVRGSVVPFLRWWSTTYTVTDRRLVTRTGVLSRSGHDLSLARVSDVSCAKGLLDRVLGCGTLVVSGAGDLAVELDDIPQVERTQRLLSELLHQHQR